MAPREGHLKGKLYAVGDGRPRGRVPIPWQDRFWRYITPGDPDACWEWNGSRDQNGYGRIQRGSRGAGLIKAHRASYEIHNGPIPDGMAVCHRCDNPPCVNPAHLFLGDMRDNSRDMASKGRSAAQRGYDNGRTVITDAQVLEMRNQAAAGVSCAVLQERFGMSKTGVQAICNGERRWKVGGPITQFARGPYGPRKKKAA